MRGGVLTQANGWQMVSLSKLGSWYLLMFISFVMVTWLHPIKTIKSLGQKEKV